MQISLPGWSRGVLSSPRARIFTDLWSEAEPSAAFLLSHRPSAKRTTAVKVQDCHQIVRDGCDACEPLCRPVHAGQGDGGVRLAWRVRLRLEVGDQGAQFRAEDPCRCSAVDQRWRGDRTGGWPVLRRLSKASQHSPRPAEVLRAQDPFTCPPSCCSQRWICRV